MSLTSQDETDLILPLFAGMDEIPHFSTFLERLRARTGAEYVALVLRHKNARSDEETEFRSGLDLAGMIRESEGGESLAPVRPPCDRLRPGRVYALSEFADLDREAASLHARALARIGIRDERVVRLAGEDDFDALLVMARVRLCTAADSALLSNLAPYVRAATRNLVVMESQRIASAMAAEGLGRSGVGWILFAPDARILSFDPATRSNLERLAGIRLSLRQRILDAGPQAESEIAAAAGEIAGNPQAEPRVVVLCDDPRIEAVLVCANGVEVAGMVSPAMLALCRLPRASSPERPERFASLFELPKREAELAICLADGFSIAEAANAMGLTLETARNYSKRLYAKLGVRGQAELVRLVYESSAVLA